MKSDQPETSIPAWQILLVLVGAVFVCFFVTLISGEDVFESFAANFSYNGLWIAIIAGFISILILKLRRTFPAQPNILSASVFLTVTTLLAVKSFWVDDFIRSLS